jgi:DNA-binding transcriptional regulator GbsR (MarR family)
MNTKEAKEKFIQAWGTFGSNWGINRTMSQIHALLLTAPESLSADEIMDQLQISRGNVNMNVRELMDWGLVKKELRMGERKEFFLAEKDIWKVAKLIITERKKRELEPMLQLLKELSATEETAKTPEEKAFAATLKNLKSFAKDADKTLDKMIKADEHWFLGTFMRLIR